MDTLRRNSWLLRIAYINKSNIPEQINVCSLSWRVLTGIILWPLHLVFTATAVAIILGLPVAIAAYRVPRKTETEIERTFVPITPWLRFRGHHVWPITIWGTPVGVYALYRFIVWVATLDSTGRSTPVGGWEVLGLFSVLGVLAGIIALVTEAPRSAWWTLFKAYLRARKDRVCPIIRIEAAKPPAA